MDHHEIRALRGPLSRAAFARLLGVTSLTVLRWELPDDNKEARRPRARTVEALLKLKEQGIPSAALASAEPDEDEDEQGMAQAGLGAADETYTLPARPSFETVPGSSAFVADRERLQPLLDQLMGESWRAAEDGLLNVLSSDTLRSSHGRTLATLGLLQAQSVYRLESRAGLMTLTPILDELERGGVPSQLAARAHLLAALLFGGPDHPLFDVGRVNAHAAQAEQLLGSDEQDLRVLLAVARIAPTRMLGPSVLLHTHDAYSHYLQPTDAPVPRFFVQAIQALVAAARGDAAASERHAAEAISAGQRLEIWPLLVTVLADLTWRALNGAAVPEKILELTQRARRCALKLERAPRELHLRILAWESEALIRQARFADADVVLEEARELARTTGAMRYPLAMPLARSYVLRNRAELLEGLADALEAEAGGGARPVANLHALTVRGISANLFGEPERASELLQQVLSAPRSARGVSYLMPHAHYEYVLSRLLLGNLDGARAALKNFLRYLEQYPSVWHGAVATQLQFLLLLATGQLVEARRKAETAIATFQMLGDVVQACLGGGQLAMLARASSAPEAEQLLAAVQREMKELGVWSPQLVRHAQILSQPAPAAGFREETLVERLHAAIERLSVRGLSHDECRRGLVFLVGELLPGREAVVGGSELSADEPGVVGVPGLADGQLRFGVRGELRREELTALRILAAFMARVLGGTVTPESDSVVDQILPHFIAASPPMRKLKTELARLSRSLATILISGESGSGKEIVARAVHDLSTRGDQAYVVFNCASVPRDLFESQLFGYRKGAFTGAVNDSPGVIRAADGGTLFLDEIGELPLDTQPKLLRFLENSEIVGLGEQKPRRVDVRIVAATHRDLAALVSDGRFREDLYYRLNVVPLHVPPLRERPEDIVALARLFIARLAPDQTEAPELGADAVSALRAHCWPGNVRELRNVIERAMAYSPVPRVLGADQLRLPSA